MSTDASTDVRADAAVDLKLGDLDATLGAVRTSSSPLGLEADAARLPLTGLAGTAGWRQSFRAYEKPDWRSAWQLISALAMLVAGWVLTLAVLRSKWFLAPLTVSIAAVAVVRCFILFHDCGHGSFSRSRRLNDVVGSLLGIIVFTPFRYWNYAHAVHHATSGDLDRRGIGDIWTMTVEEFSVASRWQRFSYRSYHSPWVMFTVGPLIKFVIIERIVTRPATTPTRIKRSVHFTNVAIVVYSVVMMALVGVGPFLITQGLILVVGGSGAIWLFYVQHRFEGAYWAHRDQWRFVDAALQGSSHMRLGRVLQYASGNIGFHHLHHLDARIPNYNLERCLREHPEARAEHEFGLRESFAARRLKLWDEEAGHFVGYRAAS